ncbi:hypothetical protein DKX38_017647 [Salix brachista]|uniref:Retrotransposon Copia-like N-terminal domain-containing protein n=1 Tax=Salix brachista TaxID=2182728 RepID=A0A5N5KWR1_9ROSI|nr:hypothetical protein DKX38_017647 [Salix brachista]
MAETMTSAAPIFVQPKTSNFNIGVVLDVNNYDLWAPLIEKHVTGRRKIGYLHGSVKAPEEDDLKHFVSARIDDLYLSFFEELYEIFQELDHYNTIAMICEKDVKIYQELQEQHRVYIFLGGLDDEFEQIHGEILCKDPLLGLQTSSAYVPEKGWDKTRDPCHGKPWASITKLKNSYKYGKEEPNLVAEHANDNHSITLIKAFGHEDIALPNEVHNKKYNDKLALESPPGIGEEPMASKWTEALDNIQSETIHDQLINDHTGQE